MGDDKSSQGLLAVIETTKKENLLSQEKLEAKVDEAIVALEQLKIEAEQAEQRRI